MALPLLKIIKVGGGVLEDPDSLTHFLDEFALIDEPKILIHGGGREASKLSQKLNIPTKIIEGRRVTDVDTLKLVTMVYAGLINKNVVAGLQKRGINSLGLTGADLRLIISQKRPPSNGIDFGFVGDIEYVNTQVLADLINKGITPVIAPLTYSVNGDLLNTNADSIASHIGVALSQTFNIELTYCFELPGVLYDPDDLTSVIPVIDDEIVISLIQDGVIKGGMIPKVTNALKAVNNGINKIIIKKFSEISEINAGTQIVKHFDK